MKCHLINTLRKDLVILQLYWWLFSSISQNVKWISNMGRFKTYLIMGGNIRLLIEKYDMNVKNVVKAWNERTSKNEECSGFVHTIMDNNDIYIKHVGYLFHYKVKYK